MAATQQAIRPQAIALAAFAVLAGLIALAVIGQLLSRQLALDAAEFPVLRAIGATRASLVALSLARLAIVTLAGGVIAVAVAIAASPLMPIGPARLAEPHPGVEVNLAILAPASPSSRCCRSRCWPAPPGGRRERPAARSASPSPPSQGTGRGSAARSPGPAR